MITKKELEEEWEKRLIQDFFLSRFWTDKIDICYIMVCEPAVAMERELRIALSQKLGETTNPLTVAKLVERYRSTYIEMVSKLHFCCNL